MEKRDIIAQLRKAKTAHIRWRSYAQALINGLPLEEDKVPVMHTDCEFGRWYHGQGQTLAVLAGFKAIAEPHEQLHTIYLEIVKQLFEPERGSLWSRLIGRSRSTKSDRTAAVHGLMDELLRVSERLLAVIERVEQEVMASNDEAIARLV